jgi:CheY-like chemotaxis protein
MDIQGLRRQLLFLLLTALLALVAGVLARFGLEEGTGKLVVLWIFTIATSLILAQGIYLWVNFGAFAKARPADENPSVPPNASSTNMALADARETVLSLESKIRELEKQVSLAKGDSTDLPIVGPAPTSGADFGRAVDSEEKDVLQPQSQMLHGIRSMMVDAGERAQAMLSGGNRLEIGITLAPTELADIRKMMAAIGRVIARPAMEEIAETQPTDGSVRVLLVDDDRTCRRIFRAMLPKDVPFHIVECDDGLAAMDLLEKPPYPDIIVCDIMMPNLDGFEFLKKVRDLPRIAHTPVVMATSNAFRENVSKAATLDVCRFLAKPLTRPDVESAIRHAMSQNERKRSSIIEAQERLCLDDKAYFELACGFSRAVTEAITFVRSAISRERWQVAAIRVNALRGSIQLVGDERLEASLGRVAYELTLWDVNRVTVEIEQLEQENERFARTLIHFFAESKEPEVPPAGVTPEAREMEPQRTEVAA